MDPKITRRAVAELTAKAFDTNLKILCSTSRSREHTKARFAVWYLVKEFRPEASLKELGRLLDKDHTTVIHGLVRAKEFAELNREFADRLHQARRMIAQWRPGEAPEAERAVSLVPPTPKPETPPAVKCGPARPLRSLSRAPESCGGFEYDAWIRQSCANSEARFLDIARREFPHLVRVPQKEAAE